MAITKADQYGQLRRFDQAVLHDTFAEKKSAYKTSQPRQRPIVDNLVDCERVVKLVSRSMECSLEVSRL